MRITVFMPVRNAENYLHESIQSILNQAYSDFEFLIIDDGSSDNSPEIISAYAKDDSRVHFIGREHKGLAATRNEGLERARGEYIAFMDADDISLPSRLERQLKFLSRRPGISVCGTGFRQFGNRNTSIYHPTDPDQIKINLLFDAAIGNPTAMLRKADIQACGCLFKDDDGSYAEDYGFWVDVSKHLKIANLRSRLLRYRVSEGQGSSASRSKQVRAATQICLEQLKALGLKLDYDAAYLLRLDTHRDIGVFGGNLDYSELLFFVDKKYQEILIRSRERNVYNERKLEGYLRQKLLRTAAALGIEGLKVFLDEDLVFKHEYERILVNLMLLKRRVYEANKK